MANDKRINTKQLAADIRSGMDDRTLLREYPITPRELREFKKRLDKFKGTSLESLEHDLKDSLVVTMDPDNRGPEPDVRDTVIMAAMDSTENRPTRMKQTPSEIEPDLRETVLIELMDKEASPRPSPSAADETPEDLLITIISSET